jgi:hypothetical protein
MANHHLIVLSLGLVLFTGCQPPSPAGVSTGPAASQGPPPPPGAASAATAPANNASDALLAAYRAAHSSRDVEAMLKLYWFGIADAEMHQIIRENVEAELRYPLTEIKLEPVAPGRHGPTVEGGNHWRPSLEVVALLTARFDTSQATPGEFATQEIQITVGKRGNKHYFTVPLRE